MNRWTYPYDESFSPALPIVEIEIEGYESNRERQVIRAIVDSGSDGTALPRSALIASGALYRDTVRIRGVTGASRQVDRFLTKIFIGDKTIRGIFAVAVSAEDDALLGRDVLNQLVATLNGPAHATEIAAD
jgi:hypothetical protein